MDTSLIISATNSGKKVTKAITNINPEKDNAVLKTFAQKVNDLTTNTYVDATRINKQSVNEQDGKPEPTLIIDNGFYTYNGDGDVYAYSENKGIVVDRVNKTFSQELPALEPYTLTLHATETANFAAKTVTAIVNPN